MAQAALLDARVLFDLATAPAASCGYSALSEQPFLLIDASGAVDPARLDAFSAWLSALPCPSLALSESRTPLAELADVHVTRLADAEPLIDNIRRTPRAAAVLVQLLRMTTRLPLEQALAAESLAYATLQAGPEFRQWLSRQSPQAIAASDDGPAVYIERRDDLLRLELNRPSTRNAMSVEMRDALVEALTLAVCDPSIRRLHIRGRGKCFSTGGELAEFGTAPDPATAHLVRSLALPGRLLAACAERAEVELHGACIGSGVEFPAFAGRVHAHPGSWFQLPELGMGLIPGAGGCVSIARRISRQRCAWLVLSGRRIDARRACDWGLVDTAG